MKFLITSLFLMSTTVAFADVTIKVSKLEHSYQDAYQGHANPVKACKGVLINGEVPDHDKCLTVDGGWTAESIAVFKKSKEIKKELKGLEKYVKNLIKETQYIRKDRNLKKQYLDAVENFQLDLGLTNLINPNPCTTRPCQYNVANYSLRIATNHGPFKDGKKFDTGAIESTVQNNVYAGGKTMALEWERLFKDGIAGLKALILVDMQKNDKPNDSKNVDSSERESGKEVPESTQEGSKSSSTKQ